MYRYDMSKTQKQKQIEDDLFIDMAMKDGNELGLKHAATMLLIELDGILGVEKTLGHIDELTKVRIYECVKTLAYERGYIQDQD
jgi:hypothetical protein